MRNTNKVKYIILSIVLMIGLVVGLLMVYNYYDRPMELSLDSLKVNNNYQFEEISWNMSVEEVKNAIPYTIVLDSESKTLPPSVNYYKSEAEFILDEQVAYAMFEFHDDRIRSVKFDFHLNEDYEQWFGRQIEKLNKLYGQESHRMENSTDVFQSIGYRWDTDYTTLQLIMVKGEDIHTTATLGIGYK